MEMIESAPASRCTVCGGELHADEAAAVACRPCARRTGEHLLALAGPDGLYARLADSLTPGRGSDGVAVSGSRTAPLPLRLEVLSLSARGGVVTILQTWLIDWHERLAWSHPRWEGGLQQQLDQVVRQLRVNLDWAAAEHPAFDEFSYEIAVVRRQCEQAVTGERRERRVSVACPCGTTLRVTVSTPGALCRGCGTQYGHIDVLGLPLAERRAA